MEKINTVTPPEQFPVTNRLPSRLLLICHTQTADTTRKPDTAARLGNAALKGELHSVSITLRASPFFFYSGCFPLEVTHIFKSRFQFITSSFLPEVTGSLCSSENTSQAHPGYEPPPLTVLKSVPGRLVRRLLCFHELCVLLLSPWLSQGFQKKKRRGSPQWKHSAHAKTTCWGDRSGLLFDISWSDSQLLWGCQARTFPAWHLCCSSPRAV